MHGLMMKKENHLVGLVNGLMLIINHQRTHGLYHLMVRQPVLCHFLHRCLKFK
ncbi:unnamed protein product [Brugia pahangi]|uniref:Uncharacterized protein n=1 Tax=Brugia pahangi TaxID=6280 RepID=A0A0N4THE2_BRUPA|nr:unnamed protein product [Brugia pahangi]